MWVEFAGYPFYLLTDFLNIQRKLLYNSNLQSILLADATHYFIRHKLLFILLFIFIYTTNLINKFSNNLKFTIL